MRLSFHQPHLSIKAFPEVELPRLTVILGRNGVGKSHLLSAIRSHAVRNSVIEAPAGASASLGMVGSDGIVLLSSEPKPMQPGIQTQQPAATTYQSQPFAMATAIMPGSYEEARAQVLRPSAAKLSALLGEDARLLGAEDPWRLGEEGVASRLGAAGRLVPEGLAGLFAEAEQALLDPTPTGTAPGVTHPPGTAVTRDAGRVAALLGIPPLAVTAHQFKTLSTWGQVTQFEANMAHLFGRYRDARLQNDLLRLKDASFGQDTAMSETRFAATYGPPPWETLTETMEGFGLPYRAVPPNAFEYSPVTLQLERTDTGEAVAQDNLSSGEKVLFRFALSLFEYNERFIGVTRPKLLLLDEMDASLHPEMANRWIAAIADGIVGRHGIPCILSTHSATTVALAPEESLYEMVDGRRGLRKVTKQEALNRLTFGVPTLSIDFSGRRQVVVESGTDAAIYERIYAVTKSELSLPRELNFISSGVRDKSGHEKNGGCGIVGELVRRLADAGNNTVYGLVDWDGEAMAENRVHVLAPGRRDGIENVLLDPLLVALLLLKVRKAPEEFQRSHRFVAVGTLNSDRLQALADMVQYAVVPRPGDVGGLTEVGYLCGAKLQLASAYARMDDHRLEEALTRAFPALRRWSANRGALTMAVVEEVVTEHRGFCPADIAEAFRGLAGG